MGKRQNVYKREGSKFYTYEFYFEGKRHRRSTGQTDKEAARDMMAAHRTALAKGDAGFRERKRLSLADFLKKEFLPFIEAKCAAKPSTLRYYATGAQTLLDSDLAGSALDVVNDQHAAQYAARRAHLSPSTINCGLRTLRRALHLAVEWGKLERMPKITLAKGERQRERILTDDEVWRYLAACSQPWRDCATILLGTGMRPGEVFALRWEAVYLNGNGGMIQITAGKSRAARRILPMVPAVHEVLRRRHDAAGKPVAGWVFPSTAKGGHLEGGSAKNQHSRAFDTLAKEAEKHDEKPMLRFCPYTMRHTALSKLAAAGCDAFTLARIAGHSSITITQRYCHPQADAIERAFAKLPQAVPATVN